MCTGKIVAIRKDGNFAELVGNGEEALVVLDRTCFYAEQGGQIYDTGVLQKGDEEVSYTNYAEYCILILKSFSFVKKLGDF